ncbi:RimK family alpha-L-glutamate ligase [Saccharicrinis sp. FJH62]|uniref:ATP-grasp domain-containing protein n=1 Tax=Saccharicrinis sp. FJH62 TaxID=3344657 RepID=UPI0035D3E3EE
MKHSDTEKHFSVAILKNEDPYNHLLWIEACKKNRKISDFEIIDIFSDNWLENVLRKKYDLFLLRPPGQTERYKRLYDERAYILSNVLKLPVYPSLTEVLIYENKRFLRDWMVSNKIPHPKTHIFYRKTDAHSFIKGDSKVPIVAKTNIGASGNGVEILNNTQDVEAYIEKAFSKGINRKIGPKVFKGSLIAKLKKVFTKRGFLKKRLKDYSDVMQELQRGYVIFQEYIPHEFEWRCVRIGGSFFAHKKLVKNSKASGTLKKNYGSIPETLLNFVKEVTEKNKLYSVAIDIFETKDSYLVNEIQCFFGQSDPYQMSVDGRPGRYLWTKDKWEFEEGMFNTNESYDLRLQHAIENL